MPHLFPPSSQEFPALQPTSNPLVTLPPLDEPLPPELPLLFELLGLLLLELLGLLLLELLGLLLLELLGLLLELLPEFELLLGLLLLELELLVLSPVSEEIGSLTGSDS